MNLPTIAIITTICVDAITIVTALSKFIKALIDRQVLTVVKDMWNKSRFLFITTLFLIIAVVLLSSLLLSVLLTNRSQTVTIVQTPTPTSTSITDERNSVLGSITYLMNQDVLAAETRNPVIVESIYTKDAVMTDAGCYLHPGVLTNYNGLVEIVNRYQHLPHFNALQHVNISVTWDPQKPMEATAMAETIGAISADNGSQMPLVGNEKWSFVLINNQWFISSFTFNLCLPT